MVRGCRANRFLNLTGQSIGTCEVATTVTGKLESGVAGFKLIDFSILTTTAGLHSTDGKGGVAGAIGGMYGLQYNVSYFGRLDVCSDADRRIELICQIHGETIGRRTIDSYRTIIKYRCSPIESVKSKIETQHTSSLSLFIDRDSSHFVVNVEHKGIISLLTLLTIEHNRHRLTVDKARNIPLTYRIRGIRTDDKLNVGIGCYRKISEVVRLIVRVEIE